MKWITLDGFSGEVILIEGAIVAGTGKICGVFASEEDAYSEDADALAIGTASYGSLTPGQRDIAESNSLEMRQR